MVERGVRENFMEKSRFKQKSKSDGIGHASIWEESSGMKNRKGKSPRQAC